MMKTALAIVAGFASASAFVTPCTTPAGCITQARAMSAVRPASVSMNLGNLFGGGDKKQGKGGEFEDVEDAVEDWKEIGFDIDEVIKAEEDAKKKDKK